MPGKQRDVHFCFLAEPSDVNIGGKVHGGMVMKWIDQAGYACAVGWSAKYCVTVAVGGIQFVEPILIGDLVSVDCKLIHTGTSSMHMFVEVKARNLETQKERQATSCVIVFVALDSPDGKPTAVPSWKPDNDEDRKLADYAQRLIKLSQDMEAEINN